MDKEALAFVQEKSAKFQELSTSMNKAYWDFTTVGSEELQNRLASLREEMVNLLANREDFMKVKQYREEGVSDPILARQLDAFYRNYLPNQMDPATIKEIVQLETQIESQFTNFRASLKGQPLSNNEILNVLQKSTDTEERKAVWLSSKQIGRQVGPLLLQLVNLRNQVAVQLGFSDFYSLTLEMGELNEEELFLVLDRLKEVTDEPFRQAKAKVDAELAQKFNCPVEALMPWHYGDPFFQEAPISDEIDLNQFYADLDVVELSKKYYDSIGLEVRDIIGRSDLYERPGKNQHAYCTHIDYEGDVRVLCNVRNTDYWMNTMLHELGHGVYDKYTDLNLPFILRGPAHMFTTEAIAMMFGKLSSNPQYLKEIAGADPAKVDRLSEQLLWQEQLALLTFIRWGLVMVYFERGMYKNPGQDLNKLWWDLVESLQYLKRPGIDNPDWAAKIHLGTYPVYYQNYILGYLGAYQFEAAVKKALGVEVLLNSQEIGKFLIEKVFEPASRYYWNDMLEMATGHRLNPDFAVEMFR